VLTDVFKNKQDMIKTTFVKSAIEHKLVKIIITTVDHYEYVLSPDCHIDLILQIRSVFDHGTFFQKILDDEYQENDCFNTFEYYHAAQVAKCIALGMIKHARSERTDHTVLLKEDLDAAIRKQCAAFPFC
jgi:hypothetical protein